MNSRKYLGFKATEVQWASKRQTRLHDLKLTKKKPKRPKPKAQNIKVASRLHHGHLVGSTRLELAGFFQGAREGKLTPRKLI